MKLVLATNKTKNSIQSKDVIALYLEIAEDGIIELCADTDESWGYLLAEITPNGKFIPNKKGVKNTKLKIDNNYY